MRFSGTSGALLQNSGAILDDDDNLTGLGELTLGGTLRNTTAIPSFELDDTDVSGVVRFIQLGVVGVWDVDPNNVDAASEARIDVDGTVRARLDANGRLGIGASAPAHDLDMQDKTGAIRLPRGTTAQRPAGSDTLIRGNSTVDLPEFWRDRWLSLLGTPDGAALAENDIFYLDSNLDLRRLAVGSAEEVLAVNSAGDGLEWAVGGGGWELISAQEPTSDVSAVTVTGLNGQGWKRLHVVAIFQLISTATLRCQVRASAGTWRTIGEGPITGAPNQSVLCDFFLENFDDDAATNFLICNTLARYITTVIDRSSSSGAGFSNSTGVASGYTSRTEVYDELRVVPGAGNIEGSDSDRRGFFMLWGHK